MVLILGVVGISVAALIAYTGMKSAFDSYNTFIGMALGPVGGIFFWVCSPSARMGTVA